MTTINFRVGGVNYSGNVFQADIWREASTGIGRWEALLDPMSVDWTGAFVADSGVFISIDDGAGPILMLRGYLDDAIRYLDTRGTYNEMWKLTGRDYGMDLAQLFISKSYRNQRADDIVQDALLTAGSEIGYVSLGVAPRIDYEFKRTYLSDGIREICDETNNLGDNYDFYVDNTPAPFGPALHFFRVGSPAEVSGVQLQSVLGNVNNNILRLPELGEVLGFGIKNYIELYNREVNDHWTDMNAVDWTGISAAVTDQVPPPALNVLHGKGSLRVTNNTGIATWIGAELSFPRYNHTVLDLSASTTGKFDYYIHNTNVIPTGIKRVRLQLRDVNLNWIEFVQFANWIGFAKCYQCTDQPDNDEWRKVTFPLGAESGIEAAAIPASTKGHWWYVLNPAPPFDWEQVDRILFYTGGGVTLMDPDDYFVVDGLQLSNVETIAIAQDAVSIANYGQRMKSYYRPDLKSQVEFDQVAPEILSKLKDPLQKIHCLTSGQTGSVFTGQRLQVLLPTSGLPAWTNYRVLSLHHRVTRSSEESDYPGFNFTTEYDLIRHEVSGAVQNADFERIEISNNPTRGYIPKLNRRQRYMSNPYRNLP